MTMNTQGATRRNRWWWVGVGAVVAVLTCNADDDYDLGGELIQAGKPAPLR